MLMSRRLGPRCRYREGVSRGPAVSAGDVRASAVLRRRPRPEAGDRAGRRPAARAAATRLGRAGSQLRRPAAAESRGASQSAVSSISTVSPSGCGCARIAGIRALSSSAWSSTSSSDRSNRHPCSSATCTVSHPSSSGSPHTWRASSSRSAASTWSRCHPLATRDAHQLAPVLDSAAQRDRALEDLRSTAA